MASIHTLLLKCRDDSAADDALVSEIVRAIAEAGLVVRGRGVHRGLTAREVYAYLELARPDHARSADALQLASQRIGAIDPLELQFEASGASKGESARFQHVVEMDPAPGWEDEIFRWYNTEHMPGLAAAPGCVRARRFLNHGGGPRSLACYDLTLPGVIESAAWLAVRNTAWSDRVRPQFQNTKRTMFRTVVERRGSESV
jgi:hypothetical protein